MDLFVFVKLFIVYKNIIFWLELDFILSFIWKVFFGSKCLIRLGYLIRQCWLLLRYFLILMFRVFFMLFKWQRFIWQKVFFIWFLYLLMREKVGLLIVFLEFSVWYIVLISVVLFVLIFLVKVQMDCLGVVVFSSFLVIFLIFFNEYMIVFGIKQFNCFMVNLVGRCCRMFFVVMREQQQFDGGLIILC